MANDQAVFSFELNESLYFERGQEVAEMLGVSLDPEISIQAFNEYVSIRGVIELRGQYAKADTNQNDISEELDDFSGKRYVENVVDTESGVTEFSHRFPVEISVPTYRVSDLDDVTVSIDHFDYELPNSSQLKFVSTIAINGINEEVDVSRDEESFSVNDTDVDQTFEFDLKESNEAEMLVKPEPIDVPDTPVLNHESRNTESNEELSVVEEENMESTNPESANTKTSEDDRWKFKKTQTFAEFFNKEPEFPQSESSVGESLNDDSVNKPSAEIMNDVPSYESHESRESNSQELTDVGYLSDMFRDDKEQFARMRVCIVQERDTLETIADRYKISKLQLVKQNNLTNEDISEGQLLYIPTKKTK